MLSANHLSEKDLLRFADGEMHEQAAATVEGHLHTCARCRSRLEQLKNAANDYDEYHARVLKPSFESPRDWPALHFPVAPVNRRRKETCLLPLWATATFAAAIAVLVLFVYKETPNRKMTTLLVHAAAVPARPHQHLQVTSNGRSWYRPAVLDTQAAGTNFKAQDSSLEHFRTLFVKANYSWDDPLSARSFAAWRNQLHNKRDQVISVRNPDGDKPFYRLRTDTSQGVLRTASLTFEADTLNPIEGRFHFEDQEEVTMAATDELSAPQPVMAEKKPAAHRGPAVETKVSPEDELRVFAALSSIGADAGEPVKVEVDPSKRNVVVSGVGIAASREQEIRQALARIPKTVTHFESAQPLPEGKSTHALDSYSTDTAAPLRHELESKAGGAQPFQQIADRALDVSSSLFAQAHALSVLGQTFPAEIEARFDVRERATLRSLRLRHVAAIRQAISQLQDILLPLLTSPPNQQDQSREAYNLSEPSWPSGADQLFSESKRLDEALNRLLAGSYSQQTGEDILGRLPDEIQHLEKLAHAQEMAP